MSNVSKCIWAIVLFVIMAVAAFANPSLTNICIYSPDALMRESNVRPVVVTIVSGRVARQVEASTYLRQTQRLSGQQIEGERASIAIQVSMARKPFQDPGALVDYIAGSAAFVDSPVLRLQSVPKITLRETVIRYLTAQTDNDRRLYGDLLVAVVNNRSTWCSFWN